MKHLGILVAAASVGLIAGSGWATAADHFVANYAKYGSQYAKYGTEPDVPGACSYQAMSHKNYKGKTLRIITNAVPVMGEPTDLHGKQFSDLTGATVKVVHAPFGDLFQRVMIPFQTGQSAYDVLIYGSLWIGDFHNYLAPVPQKYLNTAGMKDVTRTIRGIASWGKQMVQYPIDGDRQYLKYRKDVFDNPVMQARYKKATGHDLRVPQTWTEFNRIAAYFSGWDWAGDGKKHYGSAEITKRDDLMFSDFIDRVAAYAKNPHVKTGFFFNIETMQPEVNNPGWVRGLKMFIAAKKGWPPGGNNFGLADNIFSFGGGQTLMEYTWDDSFIQAMEPGSPIRNKVGTALLPGSHEVWNYQTKKWEHFDPPNRPSYESWGWTSAVSAASPNKQMAFDYLCFFSNQANASMDLGIGRFGVNPYRNAHFNADYWVRKLGWDPAVAKNYVTTLSEIDHSKNRVFDLRVPGVNQFMTSLATGVSEALAGQKTPQQALDGVAAEWKQIVNRIGKEKIRKAYANVVALENNEE